jgi:hypothetical protein
MIAKSMTFEQAASRISRRVPVGSSLASAEWRKLSADITQRAFFSAKVEDANFAQTARDFLDAFINDNVTQLPSGEFMLAAPGRAKFVEVMREKAQELGLGQLGPRPIQNIQGSARLNLIFDVHEQSAFDYAHWLQGNTEDMLDLFPAQRFIRVQEVKEPRPEHAEYEGNAYLKDDVDTWIAINDDFGVPFGPWGFNCGHDVEDVTRAEAIEEGLLDDAAQEVAPVEGYDFNTSLSASAESLDKDVIDALMARLPDSASVSGGRIEF